MSKPLRARASVAQSLVRCVGKVPNPAAPILVQRLRGDAETQRIMGLPPIGWVEETPFLQLLGTTHELLGDTHFADAVHAASMSMLKSGVFRAAQTAFTIFKKPGLSAYAQWAERMWTLSFQGLFLAYDGEEQDGVVRMVLRHAPAVGFTAPLVLGTSGVARTVFSLTKLQGQVQVLPYSARDPEVQLRLRTAAGQGSSRGT